MKDKISILILVHNAPKYVKLTLESLHKHTKKANYEVIVLDNASKIRTKLLLVYLYKIKKYIDKLAFSTYNTLFAGGNNLASSMADVKSKYFLLLNSDIEIKSDDWLDHLLRIHKKNQAGISSYGVVESEPKRVDGYCYLINADLYQKYPLSNDYQWWWAITKQQADVLARERERVQGFREHEKYLHHFGGKSGQDFRGAEGLDTSTEISKKWFKGKAPEFL
jgi:GT2 family glycosyltransferase